MKKENKKIKVLMATIECAPFVKVGGLADVAGSLPPALHDLDVDIRVIMPLYGRIDRKKFGLKKIYSHLEVPSGKRFRTINVFEGFFPGTKVKVYFIDEPEFFASRRVYKMRGQDEERFLFFSLAALYSIPALDFEPDVLHCHDSHTGLIPDLIKVSNLDYVRRLKTLFTIHNFQYQGSSEPFVLSTGNLRAESLQSLSEDVKDGDVNFMVQGVLNADKLNTVSETYAKEMTTSMYGAGLERIIRKRREDLTGIVNGIDVKKFDPRTDEFLTSNFSEKSLNRKTKNKLALQKELGLPERSDSPLCGMITRLVWQKGLELFTEEFMKLGCQFVFLGTGAEKYEKHLLALQEKYPEFVSAQIKFSTKLARKIYAASDIFLMPSRFEPCGLGQMIAMRYGTVPVVRETGGLKDTVGKQKGFSFKKFESEAFYSALEDATHAYEHMPKTWEKLQKNGMTADFSWKNSAKKYLKIYKELVH